MHRLCVGLNREESDLKCAYQERRLGHMSENHGSCSADCKTVDNESFARRERLFEVIAIIGDNGGVPGETAPF